jgi:heat shock protein HslJ
MFSRRLILMLLHGGMLALMSVGALACASCGTPAGSGAPVHSTITTTAPAPASLPGLGPRVANVDWTLLWFVLDGTEYHATDGPPITLRMDPKGDGVSGSSGCSRYSGTYAAEGVALHFQLTDVPRATCSGSVTTRDHAYLQALSGVEAYGSATPDTLWLGSVDGQTLFYYWPSFRFSGGVPPSAPTSMAPTATLASSPLGPGVAFRRWALTRFSQDGQDYPVVANVPVTLWLDDAGVGGRVACHGYGGSYVASGATLRMRVMDENLVECVHDDADVVDFLFGEYLDALGFVDSYRLADGQLVLTSGGGRLQLTFRALPCQTTGSAQARRAVTLPLSGTPEPATPWPCPAA